MTPSIPTLTEAADAAFENTFARFIAGSDAYRRERFKIIPNVAEGNWLVRRAVGNTPAILGKKLELSFYDYSKTVENYFELDVDVGSSSVRALSPSAFCPLPSALCPLPCPLCLLSSPLCSVPSALCMSLYLRSLR
jgi:hypothetical protein